MNKSRTLGLIIASSIAMLASTIVVSYDIHAEAAKSSLVFLWCYSTPNSPNDQLCYDNHGECSMVHSADGDAKSGCFKQKNGF